jgi:transposase InsO family protein
MDADFCVTALEEAIARFGKPEIFNTDQGSQFTSFDFTNTLKGCARSTAPGDPPADASSTSAHRQVS